MRDVSVSMLLIIGGLVCGCSSEVIVRNSSLAAIDQLGPTVVLSEYYGCNQDLVMQDIMAAMLMQRGVRVIDRSAASDIYEIRGASDGESSIAWLHLNYGFKTPVEHIIVLNVLTNGRSVEMGAFRVIDYNTKEVALAMTLVSSTAIGWQVHDLTEEWVDEIMDSGALVSQQ